MVGKPGYEGGAEVGSSDQIVGVFQDAPASCVLTDRDIEFDDSGFDLKN